MLLTITNFSYDAEKYNDMIKKAAQQSSFDLESLYLMNFNSEVSKEEFKAKVDEVLKLQNFKAIMLVGVPSLKGLTDETSIDEARVKKLSYNGLPVFACYSPAYILKGAKSGMSQEDKYQQWLYDLYQGFTATDLADLRDEDTKFNTFKIIESLDDVNYLIAFCEETKICSFDLETTGLEPFKDDDILTLSISPQVGCSYVLPVCTDLSKYKEGTEIKISRQDSLKALKFLSDRVFNNPEIDKYGWNIKFDMRFLHVAGVKFNGTIHEGMVITHLLDENWNERGLKFVGGGLFPKTRGYELDVKGKDWHKKYTAQEIAEYNALDTDLTLRCCLYYLDFLLKDKKLYNHYIHIDCPTLKILFEMECNGMYINRDKLQLNINKCETLIQDIHTVMLSYNEVQKFQNLKAKEAIAKEEAVIREKIATAKGSKVNYWEDKLRKLKSGEIKVYDGINFSSPKQLSALLFGSDGFGYPLPLVEGVEKETTAESALQSISDTTGFVKELQKLRKVEKVYNAFLTAFEEKVDSKGYIHTTFNQTGTVTGRLSCKDPNLQQIPRGTNDISVLVKEVFTAPEGYVIMQADLSQAELRIAAKLAGDPVMINAYANDLDLHTLTAQKTLGISPTAWESLDKTQKKEKRTAAKAINFGFLYGMSSNKFLLYAKDNYGVLLTEVQAQEIRDAFFKTYHQLRPWHSVYKSRVKQNKYVETLFGRRRRLPEIDSQDTGIVASAERQAINSPVQGTGGEYTLFGLVWLKQKLNPDDVIFVNTVHDSIILYVKEGKVTGVAKQIKEIMENLPTMGYFNFTMAPVGMKVDVESGKDWANLKEVEFSS